MFRSNGFDRVVDQMNAYIQHALTNWKTTTQSILTTTFAITGYLMVASAISPHTAGILVTVNGLCKVLLGCIEVDATKPPQP
jgi:hypothetical protein